jgi:hypothetical protein
MKFIVVLTSQVVNEEDSDHLEEEVTETEVDMVFCETEADVNTAVTKAYHTTTHIIEWAVFENVDNRPVRRSLTWSMEAGTFSVS